MMAATAHPESVLMTGAKRQRQALLRTARQKCVYNDSSTVEQDPSEMHQNASEVQPEYKGQGAG